METDPAANGRRAGHELQDASPRALAYLALVLFLVVVFVLFSMKLLFTHFAKSQPLGPPSTPFASARSLPPLPRLQVTPQLDLQSYREAQQEVLESYGWVDKQNGVVRIPVERAMELLLQRGLPTRQGSSAGDVAAAAALAAATIDSTTPVASRRKGGKRR